MNKEYEITVKMDETLFNKASEIVKARRENGAFQSFIDIFWIRLLDAMNKDMKVLSFKIKDDKTVIRNYAQKHDNNR